jgi:hypothetical protein
MKALTSITVRFGAAVAGTALILTACAADNGGVATAGGTGEAGDTQQDMDAEAQALAFADCMRENGVDMADPGPGQAGLISALQEARGGHGQAPVNERFDDAFEACQSLAPVLAHEDDAHTDEELMLALVDCLREQGLDVPDDLWTEGGIPHGDAEGRDELSAAMEECRDVGGFGDAP